MQQPNENALRILCAHQGSELYGSDRVFIQSIKAIRKAWPNAHITVHLPQKGPIVQEILPYTKNITYGNMWVFRKANFKIKYLKNILLLPRCLYAALKNMRQHDVLYINTTVMFGYILLSRLTGKPMLVHAHEYSVGWRGKVMNTLMRACGPHLIANSRATAKAFSHTRNAVIIPNAVADTTIKSKKPDFEQPLKVLLIGRINSWKGHHLALDALKIILKNYSNIQIRFAGSVFTGQEHFKESLLDRIKNENLEAHVDMWAFDPNPAFHYHWADILIVPSTEPEPFGLVAIEAMSNRLPVIAADHGGLSDIVVNNKTGYVFKPRDAGDLAYAIERYISHPELLNSHGEAGRERFVAKYHEDRYLENFIKTVKEHVQ